MRLTKVLLQVNYKRHFERMWKRQGRLQASSLKVPEELRALGVEIKDAKEILYETNTFRRNDKSKPPLPTPPSVYYKEKYFYMINHNTQVSESENQILSLTKTVPYGGLPLKLNALIGACSLPNLDEMMQMSILQSHLWDTYQDKLPRQKDPERPTYVFKRAYGLHYDRKVIGLLEKLPYLCDKAISKYPASLHRDKVVDAFCKIAVERNGESITFDMPCDVLITANQPLSRFASESDVNSTVEIEVPNIYPIKHTLDLEKLDEKPVCASTMKLNNSNIHTLFLGHKSYAVWSGTELLARAIATCFAFCAQEARMKYGMDVKELPAPVSVQCVSMDLNSFNFLTYQLNTLDLGHNDGVKNQAWIDGHDTLFDSVSNEQLLSNYNPTFLPKLLALYANGLLHTTSP